MGEEELGLDGDKPRYPVTDLKTFLQDIGNHQKVMILNFVQWAQTKNGKEAYLRALDVDLHCPICESVQTFRCEVDPQVDEGEDELVLVVYECTSCSDEVKTYVLKTTIEEDPDLTHGIVYKIGENPPLAPRSPKRLMNLIAEHRELFLKGRRAEMEGLGIGAFTYYRRVVESAKDAIFDAMIKVARLEGEDAMVVELEAAKKEIQFTKAVDAVKHGIPKTLEIHGENPLKLLHGALSEGVHALSDEDCVQLAHAVRVVLVKFAGRLADVVQEDAEMAAAVKQLRQKRLKK
jgi:hypothetical protein